MEGAGRGEPRGHLHQTPLHEERVNSLCNLFGCRCARGRAGGAPSLKRVGETGPLFAAEAAYAVEGQIVVRDGHKYAAVKYEGESLPEAYLHDERWLPHQLTGNLAVLFPRAAVPPELEEAPEANDWLEARADRERQGPNWLTSC